MPKVNVIYTEELPEKDGEILFHELGVVGFHDEVFTAEANEFPDKLQYSNCPPMGFGNSYYTSFGAWSSMLVSCITRFLDDEYDEHETCLFWWWDAANNR